MKKLSILLALLLVAAVAFGVVTLTQKGDLQKQADELTAKLTAAVSDKDAAVKQADELKTQLDTAATDKTTLEEQIASLTGESDVIKACQKSVADCKVRQHYFRNQGKNRCGGTSFPRYGRRI